MSLSFNSAARRKLVILALVTPLLASGLMCALAFSLLALLGNRYTIEQIAWAVASGWFVWQLYYVYRAVRVWQDRP